MEKTSLKTDFCWCNIATGKTVINQTLLLLLQPLAREELKMITDVGNVFFCFGSLINMNTGNTANAWIIKTV